MARFLCRQPPSEGPPAFSRWATGQETLDAYILVQQFPPESLAIAYQFPVSAFLWSSVYKPGIPRQRHGDAPAVTETDGQSIVSGRDALNFLGFNPNG